MGAQVDGLARTFARLVAPSTEARQALGALTRLRELATVDAAVPLEEFWALLDAALAVPSGPSAGPTPGHVFVGELGSALGIDFPLTIVPGLVEGGFPAAVRQDPILLDEERRRLTGLPLGQDARALERLRFLLAVGSGARRVLLTYPRVDAESGRPRVPSFLVLDLLEQVTGGRHDFQALERFPGWRGAPLHPAPPSARERPLDAREWLVTRALAARAHPDGSSGACPARVEACHDPDAGGHGRAHGLRRASRHGRRPRGVPLSPTALERYAVCPFRFLMERVYGLEALEEPDRILLIDARDRGEIVHAALEAAFRRLAEEGAFPSRRSAFRRRGRRSRPPSPTCAPTPSAAA